MLTHWHLKRPKQPIKDLGICPACDVITFDRERHHLCSSCRAGQDLSNDLIGFMELDICTKTFWNCSKKLRGKFPLSTLCLSMASISWLVNALSEILELKRSLVEGQQLQQKDRKREKGKAKKKMIKSLKCWDGLLPKNYPQTLTFAHAWAKRSLLWVKCKDTFCVSKAVLIDLRPFQLILDLKMSKTS